MVQTRLHGVKITGLASAVPEITQDTTILRDFFGEDDLRKIRDSSGVAIRRVVPSDGSICTSDLCAAAAERLIAEIGGDRQTIDGLIFVSQTPDYLLPATACILHGKLGLAKSCAAFDVNLGCSGYVYGLWLAAQMISSGGCTRVMVLAGDTVSRLASPQDRSVAPLFGDAGTATLLERDPEAAPMHFRIGSDGKGAQNLIVPAGGFRQRSDSVTRERTAREGGNIRSDDDLFMNGGEIFTFTLREVPTLVQNAREDAGWEIEDVDAFVFHQANRFMLQHLAKKMKLPQDRVVVALENFGNTSSASIPLAITHSLATRLKTESLRLMLVGFGVGYSWGAIALSCGPLILPDLIVVPSPTAQKRLANADI